MINIGIIGFGGIAQAHRAAYEKLAAKGLPVRLKAACDINQEQFTKKTAINLGTADIDESKQLAGYTDLEAMLAQESLDLIDICLPTFLHADYAIDMLKRGYNVLSEKPMARTGQQCRDMLEAAGQAKGRLMIGQCLRFYPQYELIRELIDQGTYGRVISGFFERTSGPPIWAWQNWYMDYERSGGCLLDMHIHDLDMIRYLFGEPESVSCRTQNVRSRLDVVHSRLEYADKPIFAIGDWSMDGCSFQHGYRIGFEQATVIFDSQVVTVYPRDGASFTADLAYEEGGIEREIAYFTGLLESGQANLKNPPESAALTVRLAEALRDSAQQGGVRLSFSGGTHT